MLFCDYVIDEIIFQYIANNGRVFYLKTNLKADRYKLISIDLDNPSQV